jgi:hypothetical protein
MLKIDSKVTESAQQVVATVSLERDRQWQAQCQLEREIASRCRPIVVLHFIEQGNAPDRLEVLSWSGAFTRARFGFFIF